MPALPAPGRLAGPGAPLLVLPGCDPAAAGVSAWPALPELPELPPRGPGHGGTLVGPFAGLPIRSRE